ncbi:N-terminal Xaa-Pro-Lys N-methyltransferase 1 isoform X3 [Petaurus breviceps papuanus]|uniref:N-terminal Xaa-Pro-Lys N-methyltransferase 1 isoform X3 n=1 Tax=Petaurus breviceps papuanus TaxID=3040969 RepID=UPI0036D9FA0D
MTSEVVEDESQFYLKAEKYWKDVPPTVDGMLGGYGHISNIDINSSKKFLQRFLREGPNRTGTNCALDCGAGIGRITKRLLLPLFKVVDMVDVTEDFLIKAKTYLGEEGRRVTLLISTLLNSYEGARQACGPMASLSSRTTWPRKV